MQRDAPHSTASAPQPLTPYPCGSDWVGDRPSRGGDPHRTSALCHALQSKADACRLP
ncbi:MAG: hypothetical protein KME26_27645 [Oscillatoria princeps RMCB-10]|nr:hypothetical protein [Oscillatoria princeps RMCB-10]